MYLCFFSHLAGGLVGPHHVSMYFSHLDSSWLYLIISMYFSHLGGGLVGPHHIYVFFSFRQ